MKKRVQITFCVSALVTLSLLLATSATALPIDDFDYKDAAALGAEWKPQGESQPGQMSMDGNMVQAARLPLSFASLKGWRVYWDREIKADLKDEDQIVIKLKVADPSAVSQVIVYMQSGDGWYVFPAFGVSEEFEEKSLLKSQADTEDKPTGWHAINRIRIAFLPAKKADTTANLASISTRAGWPLDHAGSMGGFKDFASAKAGFTAQAKGRPCAQDVAASLGAAQALLKRAKAEKDKALRQELILQARGEVAKAYALVQEPPQGPEERVFWVHHADGVRGPGNQRLYTWKEALPGIRARGFNVVAPNVLWSGIAFYPSKLVNTEPAHIPKEDYMRQILDAAKPLGMKVYAWKVMWQYPIDWLSKPESMEAVKKAGRLQVDLKGETKSWLCPSLPANRDFEVATIVELATNYEVDGVHLDYIRYGGPEVCYCEHCHHAFESWSKKKVASWPKDAAPDGARAEEYGDFKRDNITRIVREIRTALKKVRPACELSAAVFPIPSLARNAVYQDWPRWVDEGLLDMVSTMSYTENADSFRAQVAQQKAITQGKTRLIPGMRFTYGGNKVLDLQSAVDQIKAVRELGLPGFNVFEYRDHLEDTLMPWLSAGLMREGDYQLRFRQAGTPVK